ncbi:chitin synthase-domain-containing protein [Choanephora cucurbitarum]|nr:chitin synthase-domain-containing protein [Choanephora cucurbitarum]
MDSHHVSFPLNHDTRQKSMTLKRSTSMVRPERSRINPDHPQYHTRRKISEKENDRQKAALLTIINPTRRSVIRRGIMTRENSDEPKAEDLLSPKKSLDLWKGFCFLVTCCCPSTLLQTLGKKDRNAQMAFREKIGLVTIILAIMASVGFLTFGFTQTVCPQPPLSFRIDSIGQGYVIIHGWAYLLASWNGHPTTHNVIYEPINAGGKDASFLFQTINQHCRSVFLPKKSGVTVGQDELPAYFPCQLLDGSNVYHHDSTTACHSAQSFRVLESMRTQGILNPEGKYDRAGRVYYDWIDINATSSLAVYNRYIYIIKQHHVFNPIYSEVLNLKLLSLLPKASFNVPPNGLIDQITSNISYYSGKDLTHIVASHPEDGSSLSWKTEANCLLETIKVGEVDTKSLGCIASDIVLYASLIVILGVIFVKFFLAVIFGWFLSFKLGSFSTERKATYRERMRRDLEIEDWTTGIHVPAEAIRPTSYNRIQSPYASPLNKKRSLIPTKSRFTQPETGLSHFNSYENSMIWKQAGPFGSPKPLVSNGFLSPRTTLENRSRTLSIQSFETVQTLRCPYELSPHVVRQPKPDYAPFGFTLAHTICLVTCYSEGEEGLRTTLDSIATTDYPNSHKLILVVADGMITGHGNPMSTPDICLSMMHHFLVPPDQVEAHSYVAIADGTKRHNRAKVYAGFYRYDDKTVDRHLQHKVPMITIAKCGTPEEDTKPGNRGKRDSQVILMSFLQKVMFDERMTELEYAIFSHLWRITGVSPDCFEIVLMVDADTKVYPDAMSRLVSCMVKDPEVMGLCGETKIGNKTDSWVSMIQVFEYYISHHQSKAFESIFGNVTCLPGCFCMYRIKAPKGLNGHWVPILANPDIIEHYSENVVDTLHKKNLLLLGEDRYLSTLMLKTFPRRKMLFVPQAVCKTVVPDTFSVLLSQRRRWINSTIHNLIELLFVRDLCGTFCFSMQFVVFMELVGTLALPAAISFTLYLIVLAMLGQPAIISLILLALILGLPAILIVMTSRKLIYVGWMFIYLFSLPIWNFVLPSYAYWHFDDFTWGETRRVEGGGKDNHGDKEGEFDSTQITMKKWSEFERDRRMREAAMERAKPDYVQQPEPIHRNTELKQDIPLTNPHLIPTRVLDSAKVFEDYLRNQGIALEKDSLPTMKQIVNYCERHPRLLRVRDSVLKNFHNPTIPHHLIHNYYVEIAFKYLNDSLSILWEHWEIDYRRNREDTRLLASLFSMLVNSMHRCHTDTLLALSLPFPEGSALGNEELKKRVIQANVALIHEKITPSFIDIRNLFYSIALEYLEASPSRPCFSHHVAKYEPSQLEHDAQLILDQNTSRLYDVFNLPTDVLDKACQQPLTTKTQDEIEVIENLSLDVTQLDQKIQDFAFVCGCLDELGLIPNWMDLLKPKIKHRLAHSKWRNAWDISMVDIQLTWLHAFVLPWLSYVMPHAQDIDDNWYRFLRMKIKAEHVTYHMIYEDRIPALFDIIREYPETHKAIEDFHMIATKRGLLNDLKDRLIEALQARLLHQGASAMDILQQYIACIRCLAIIDPSCSIMGPVIDVISDYVNTYRNDIVQGVVELIRDAEEHELLEREDEAIYRFESSELYQQEIPKDTVIIQEDTPAMLRRLQRKSKDPIAMLISLCRSLKDFIKGYSDQLGQVLLETKGYAIDEEVRRLEILKQNFPVDAFHRCDVMLRDMSESRRLDKAIHQNSTLDPSFHAIIMSRKYWPGGGHDDEDEDEEEEETTILWPDHASYMDQYDQAYQKAKASRKLKFMAQKGSVTIELAFESRTLCVDVSPDAALVIRLFETKANQLKAADVAQQSGMSKTRAVKALEFWVKEQVLSLSGHGFYSLVEE